MASGRIMFINVLGLVVLSSHMCVKPLQFLAFVVPREYNLLILYVERVMWPTELKKKLPYTKKLSHNRNLKITRNYVRF